MDAAVLGLLDANLQARAGIAGVGRELPARRDRNVRGQVEAASARGLDVIAYEGGQHLVGHGGAENNKELMELFHAANRHPRMKQLYLDYLADWRAAAAQLFAVFSSVVGYSKWGSWGMLEHEFQDPSSAPKYQAVMEFLERNPRWWSGQRGEPDEPRF